MRPRVVVRTRAVPRVAEEVAPSPPKHLSLGIRSCVTYHPSSMIATSHPADTLTHAIATCGGPVCVGLDPVLEQLPEQVRARHHEPLAAVADFCRGVLSSVRGIAPVVKFQSACFERYGGKGVTLLEELSEAAASMGMVVVWDAKRGDIGISANHYAAAAKRMHAHYVTLSGYLGESSILPFLDAGLGVFVLVRTSNPDSDAIQSTELSKGGTIATHMARLVAKIGERYIGPSGFSSVGAVVGATKAGDGAALRALMPQQHFLIPGYGAQGGTAADVRTMIAAPHERSGVVVTSSRAIIYAPGNPGEPWTTAVKAAAERLVGEIRDVVAG